jgi:hypothetical protein
MECRAGIACYEGVARCRLSQREEQALCAYRYLTADREEGLLFSAAGTEHRFPLVKPAPFLFAINTMIGYARRG